MDRLTDPPSLRASLDDGDGTPTWSLLVAGDCYLPASGTGDPFVEPRLERHIADADVSVVNFEAPVAPADATPIDKSGPALRMHPDAAGRLATQGFDLATLANNHVMDYGAAGLDGALDACAAAGLDVVGAGDDEEDALSPALFSPEPGVDVAVVNVCEREFNVAEGDSPGAAWDARPAVTDRIETLASDVDAVVVIAHGGVEYAPLPPAERRERLAGFVDAGADLVVGHHPHVPQGIEYHDGVPIVHSLGNFYFETQLDSPSTRRGLVLDVGFDGGTPVFADLLPTVADEDGVDLAPAGATVDEAAAGPSADETCSYVERASAVLDDEEAFAAHWQEVAVELFYHRYSNWLHVGTDGGLASARAAPNDPAAQRQFWDPEARRESLLTLLNVIRMDSHRWVVTEALSVLSGERPDERTAAVREEVEWLMDRTRREAT